jgi:hypothetical protein
MLMPDLDNYNLGLNMFENSGPRRCLDFRDRERPLGRSRHRWEDNIKWIVNMVLRNKLDTTNSGNPRVM